MKRKKFFGQHFLTDTSVVAAIVAAADLDLKTNVLEIGPGEGVLTRELVKNAKRVVAIDLDREAVESTRENVASDVLQVVEGDVLEMSNEEISELFYGEPYVLVGNIPYNITSDLLSKFLVQENAPIRSVWMVQKEVADRMLAGAGDMSRIGLMVQMYTSGHRVAKVSRGAFSPPPKVDSAVVLLVHETSEDLHERGIEDAEAILRFARVAFTSKRKQLATTLSSQPDVSSEQVASALFKINESEKARPEELSVDQWVALYRELKINVCI
jgi:16S rRNA (adenine1518-N6/adenine1519-N6)-dimethyltransferase